jgi:hypothetical protein
VTVALARQHDTLAVSAPALELAGRLSKTEFVPSALRGRPEAIMAAILTGGELGIDPMVSLRGIHIIEGKPTLTAELQRALILAAGHRVWPEEQSSRRVVLCGQRRGDDHEYKVVWEWADAERAGLASKANWRKYPRQMLLARATSELARLAFADVTAGMYAPEDFDETADTQPVDDPPKTTKRRRTTKGVKAPAAPSAPTTMPAPPLPPLPHEISAQRGSGGEPGTGSSEPGSVSDDPEPAVEAELVDDEPWPEPEKASRKVDTTAVQRLVIHCQKNNLDDDMRHQLAAHVTQGRAESFNDLTEDELAVIRSIVDDLADGTAGLVYDQTGALAVIRNTGQPTVVPTDAVGWRTLAAEAGWTPAKALLQARRIAKELDIEPPGALEDIAHHELAARLRAALQELPL